MGRSPPFRVQHMQLIDALFGLGFPTPASRKELSSLHILTRRLIKQKARYHRVIFTFSKNEPSVIGYWLLVIRATVCAAWAAVAFITGAPAPLFSLLTNND